MTCGAATATYGATTVVVAVGGVASVADASTRGDARPMKMTGEVFLHLRRSAAKEMEDCNSR